MLIIIITGIITNTTNIQINNKEKTDISFVKCVVSVCYEHFAITEILLP